ncbi:DMT family transporter [Kribbella sp. VKM Ac-2566]|uniref:DMT family transporter n=1 Tax=Kribbella sp. VKM Ac-2566 TaxID=2512218 RepID=UPI0010D6795A|nr:DMT family transporter [Kribbella sp. VKM Ac-2566]TDX08254.1 drug/metabolite transporter (DMT)-like permease [Kribbella sp. VKM Ac-2566]
MFDRRRVMVAVAVTVLLWSSAFVAIRIALTGFGVYGQVVGRLLMASLVLALAAPLLHVRMPARHDLPRIVWCGLTGMTAYQLLLNAGERSVPAGTASLLIKTSPVIAAVLAVLVLREPLHRHSIFGLALGFAGASVIALSQGDGLTPSLDAGYVVGAALAQASFFVAQKPLLSCYSGIEVTCHATWLGTILSLPLMPDLIRAVPHVSTAAAWALLYLGVGPSALGFATWAYALARLPVAAAANTLNLVPFLAIGIGWAALGESIHSAALAGGLMILIGVTVGRQRGGITR